MPGQISNEGSKTALQKTFIDTQTYAMLLAPSGGFTVDKTTTLAAAAAYEVASNTGYVRKAISWNAPTVVGGNAQISNNGQIDFGNWLVDQGVNKIAVVLIVDVASGTAGKILASFTLASGSELQPSSGQPVRITSGGLTISNN